MGSPCEQRFVVRVIVFIIVLRNFDRESFGQVSFVFTIQSYAIVFRMAHDENITAAFCHCKKQACLIAFRQNSEVFAGMNIGDRNFGMSGMRSKKYIIKTTHQRNLAIKNFMPEKAKHLFLQRFFLQAIEMVKTSLRCPAQEDRRCYMLLCPVQDFRQFFPVIHLFERHLLHRGTCNDHPIKFTLLHI